MSERSRRTQLIKAVREGSLTREALEHLSDEDRAFAELLLQYPLAGLDRLIDAPAYMIERAATIPQKARAGRKAGILPRLLFDSWAQPSAAGVRGATGTDSRRIQVDLGPAVLDLRGEKETSGWFFTARIEPGDRASEWVIKAGKLAIRSNRQGFFEWHSTRPPVSLKLTSEEGETFTLPKLQWTRTRKK